MLARLLLAFALLVAGPAVAQQSISTLPQVATPRDADLLPLDVQSFPLGQRTHAVSAAGLAQYLLGKIPLGPQGIPGNTGPVGPANSLSVGTVSASDPGSNPLISIVGTAPSQILNFTLPRGAPGPQGPQGLAGATGPAGPQGVAGPTGAAGPPNTLSIGTVATSDAGAPAAASVSGAAPNQALNLTLPRGIQGPIGPVGPTGNGTGNVLGPSGGSTAAHIATFSDTTGTRLSDGGVLGTAAAQPVAFFAQAGNNLSDLASSSAARLNLGLGSLAVRSDIVALDSSQTQVTIPNSTGNPGVATILAQIQATANAAFPASSAGTAATKNVGTTLGTVADGSVDPIARGAVQAAGGDASGTVWTAASGLVPLTASNRGAFHLTVEDFGAKGDCVTDDTGAFNAFATALRTRSGYQQYTRDFALGNGRCYILAGSVNLTGFSPLIFDGHGSTIIGQVEGYAVLDAVQTSRAVFRDFTLIGAGNTPRVGIQIGRPLNGLYGAQANAFHNVVLDGAFSLAAIYNRASESTLYDNVVAVNRSTAAGSYAAIFDGSAYWPITSQFSSTYNPSSPAVADALYGTSPNMSFNENTVIGGTYISYASPALWLSNFRGLAFENPYVSGYYNTPSQGPAALLYFGVGEVPTQLRWKVHAEGNLTSDIQFVGAQASPTLNGFDYENHIDSTLGNALSLGSGVTSATVKAAHIRVGSFFKAGTTLFDTGPAWTVTGEVSVPLANYNGGTVNGTLDTGSGPLFSGTLGNVSAGTLSAAAVNAATIGNPGAVSGVSVVKPTTSPSIWANKTLAGNLPSISLASANGAGGGATATLQNLALSQPPTLSGGAGCAVGNTFNLTDAQLGGGVFGGGQAYYTATSVDGNGAVTGYSWASTSGNAYLWAKPMSTQTTLTARSSTCTTLPTVTVSSGYPNAIWDLSNGAGTLKAALAFTAGSGYTAPPNYAFGPAFDTAYAGGGVLAFTLTASLSVGAGGSQAVFDSTGMRLQAHLASSGTAPSLSACGTSPSISSGATDTKGTITEGSSATGCTATFATAYATAPDCTVTSPNGAPLTGYSTSVSALTISNASASGNKYTYVCSQ